MTADTRHLGARRRLALALFLTAPGVWAGDAAGDTVGDMSGGSGEGARPPCAVAGDTGDMGATAVAGLEACATAEATAAERERRVLQRHERALDATDDILLKARLELERMQEGEDSGAAGNDGPARRELGRLSDLEEAAPGDADAEDSAEEERLPPGLAGAEEAEAGTATATATAGAVGRGGKNLPAPPADVGSGQDDDIVARQLREAAAKEPDPEVREKLWDEYRRYKRGG